MHELHQMSSSLPNCLGSFATMRDLFLDGVPILDALEVSGSTAAAARWMNCDQSSISRAYRRVSNQLGLGFNKDDGDYQASSNLELLASLRQASQLRRLIGGAAQLQWLLHQDLRQSLPVTGVRAPLSCGWGTGQTCTALLQRRVVDLAVVCTAGLGQSRSSDGLALLPLGVGDQAPLTALVLAELQDHPSLRALVQHLQQLRPAA